MTPVLMCQRSPIRATLLAALTACLCHGEVRTFKDTSGRRIQAEVVSVSGEAVTLRRDDGRTFLHPLSLFSPDDQAFIRNGGVSAKPVPSPPSGNGAKADTPPTTVTEPKAGAKPPSTGAQPYLLDARVRIGKSDRLSKIERFDNRALRLSVGVDVTNRHPTRELRGAKGTLVIMGRSVVDLHEYAVLAREEFPVDVPVKAPFSFDGKDIASEYDDKGGSSRFGYTYSGYVFVIQDAEGRIIHASASPGGSARYAEKALTLKPLTYLDRDFEPLKTKPATTVRMQ